MIFLLLQDIEETPGDNKLLTDKKSHVISLHSTDLDSLLSHTIGNTMNELIFGLTYEKTNPAWNRIQYLREEGIKVII